MLSTISVDNDGLSLMVGKPQGKRKAALTATERQQRWRAKKRRDAIFGPKSAMPLHPADIGAKAPGAAAVPAREGPPPAWHWRPSYARWLRLYFIKFYAAAGRLRHHRRGVAVGAARLTARLQPPTALLSDALIEAEVGEAPGASSCVLASSSRQIRWMYQLFYPRGAGTGDGGEAAQPGVEFFSVKLAARRFSGMTIPLHDKQMFFKYYTAEAAKIVLRTTSLKWSTPLQFNDPFDNQFDLYYETPDDLLVESQLKQFIEAITSPEPLRPNQYGPKTEEMEFIRQVHMQNPDIKYTEDHLAYLRGGVIEGMQRVMAYMPQANEEIRQLMADTSVFCLSETRENLLMSSHYAQNHTGAVIEFRVLPEVDSPTLAAKPVRYSNKTPRLGFC